jgi:hypothetical protein
MEKEVKVVITQEDAPYADEEWYGEYTVRRWTWREKNQATVKSTNLLDSKRAISEFNVVEYETQMLLTCIKEAPFDITDRELFYERLIGMDMNVGDKLITAARGLNNITTLETKAFLPPGDEDKDTPG